MFTLFVVLVSYYHSDFSLVREALIMCENGKDDLITVLCDV
jgi:hypothetical protein